jgi:hypothetical protein
VLPSPFIPNHIYKRTALQDEYGGNRQGGIATSAKYPYIFIFTKPTAHKLHGYADRWENDKVFSYTGEGQSGDMRFIKGNLALREHINRGKRVFLFEYVQTGYVKFVSEMEVIDYDYFETHDTQGQLRLGIRFFFKRQGIQLPEQANKFLGVQKAEDSKILRQIDIPGVTERQGLVTSRVGQGAYRKSIIHRWEYECAVTGFDKPEILIASHIKPWRDSNNEERLDVNNGILLSPNYDALFDRHLISFENSGKIILSDAIEAQAYEKIGVTKDDRIIKLNSDNHYFLEHHRKVFYSERGT